MGQQIEVTAAGFPANPNRAVFPHDWIKDDAGEWVFTYEVRDAAGSTLVCGLAYADAVAEVSA